MVKIGHETLLEEHAKRLLWWLQLTCAITKSGLLLYLHPVKIIWKQILQSWRGWKLNWGWCGGWCRGWSWRGGGRLRVFTTFFSICFKEGKGARRSVSANYVESVFFNTPYQSLCMAWGVSSIVTQSTSCLFYCNVIASRRQIFRTNPI